MMYKLGDSLPNPEDMMFPLDSGRLSLNAVATHGARTTESFDRWQTPADLSRWCVEAKLLAVAPPASPEDLEAARALREVIYRMVQAARTQQPLDRSDIEFLNDWAARPARVPQLMTNGRMVKWAAEEPLEAALVSVARDAIDLLAGESIGRIRECAEESCSILFVDNSRPGKRRWCSMERCGNRIKKKAFRQRQRSLNQNASQSEEPFPDQPDENLSSR
jgi:predicted RNA-binding Zn ribbon-like protein